MEKGCATATRQISFLILGVNYVSTCWPKPVMLTTKFKGEKFYLMSVTKFTNLSGNQVPLVFLHINSVNIILEKKYKVKKIQTNQMLQYLNQIKSNLNTSSFFSFFLFLRWESSSCEGALSSAAYSRVNPSIAPLTIRSFFFVSSSRTSSSSSPSSAF